MSLLVSYIVRAILRATALVALVLVAVASVVEFVGQLDDVGLASYGLPQALLYVALRTPTKLFDVLPAAALIGSLLGLGNLAVHRELVVLRTSGVSQYRLVAAAGAAGAVLLVVMWLLGESLAPSLGDYARRSRADALFESVNTVSAQSMVLWEGDRIFDLRGPAPGEVSGLRIRVFEIEGDTALRRIEEAELVAPVRPGSEVWEMLDYAETEFSDSGTSARRMTQLRRDVGLSREMLELSEVRVDLLELPQLKQRIDYLESRGLDAGQFLGAYWGRIANSTSVVLMTMLALPFVLGSLRSASAGARMIVGLIIGLGYYVLGELSASIPEVFALDPVVAAWAPSALLLAITVVAVARLR
jgi:lipopolysaccharide export system permease protein